MAVTESTMMELGHPAPDFSLPAANPEVGGGQRKIGSRVAQLHHGGLGNGHDWFRRLFSSNGRKNANPVTQGVGHVIRET